VTLRGGLDESSQSLFMLFETLLLMLLQVNIFVTGQNKAL
jgi:hypothetical protein